MVLGATAPCVGATGARAALAADDEFELGAVAATSDAAALDPVGTLVPISFAESGSLRGGDATPVEPEFVFPGVDGLDVGALPIGDETGAVGQVTGVVGEETGAVGVETGTTPGGGDVGVDGVGVGFAGEETGFGVPVGEGEAGGVVGVGVEVGVGVGVAVGAGAGVGAAVGSGSNENALPPASTATHDAAEKHDTALRFPRRSSRDGADHAELAYSRSLPKASTAVQEAPIHEIPVSSPNESIDVAAPHPAPL